MSSILQKDDKYITIKYTIEEYNNLFDYNLYEMSDTDVSSELISNLDKSLKIPKDLLVNI